ncbi:MAG: putative EAL-domain containing protein YkuI [Smithella sp. PtaU1.Bin162]|nr:MAG: putative EAL-domain containing protein YkuI [Smithella sp. PtaU1.Bin162]
MLSLSRRLELSSDVLREIIAEERIFVEFQSVLSVRNHSVIGFEELIRGKSKAGALIPAIFLFEAAREHGLVLELDRICREKALAAFRHSYLQKNGLLFLNMDTSILTSEVVGSGYLLQQLRRYEIPASSIVVEIVESKTRDTAALISFVNSCREYGLNIALDDVGSGHSNFDRISMLCPDIIKIDRSIISGITENYLKQEIFKALVRLSGSIGTLALAEGTETQKESVFCIECGADLVQGYFFSRPGNIRCQDLFREEQSLEFLLSIVKKKKIAALKTRQLMHRQYQKVLKNIIAKIRGKSPEDMENMLREAFNQYEFLDALYVVNAEGVQITDTVMKRNDDKSVSPVFRAAKKNENLAHKDYVYNLINTKLKQYTTEHYISFATGNFCITLSKLFKGKNNRNCILCADFLINDIAGNKSSPLRKKFTG